MAKKKKELIGEIKGLEILKQTKGIYKPVFKTGGYQSEKDKPRQKNWRKWVD